MSGRVVLVGQQENLKALYALNFKIYMEVEVIEKNDEAEVIALLKEDSSISTIVSEASAGEKKMASAIHNYLKDSKLSIPLIVLGTDADLNNDCLVVEDPLELKICIRAIAKQLEITAKMMAEKVVPQYYPIPLAFFHPASKVICDVFEFVLKGEEGQYVQRYKNADAISEADLNTWKQEGVRHLFVPSVERLKFVNFFSDQVFGKLGDKNLSTAERVAATGRSYDIVSEFVSSSGLSPQVVKYTKATLNSMKYVCSKSPSLADMMEDLLNSQASYRYRHCQLLSYLTLHIVKNLDWGTKDQMEKLAFVCFFHDLTLKSDAWAQIKTDAEVDDPARGLDENEKKIVRSHALDAATLVQEYPSAPMGVDIIVKQHHGSRNGTGFPARPGSISPLALVFIVAEEWANLLLAKEELGGKLTKKQILNILKKKFTDSPFRGALKAVNKLKF